MLAGRLAWTISGMLLLPALAWGQSGLSGQSGLVNMPDARIAPDGTWRTGFNTARPYRAIWSSLALFPFLEVSGRYTEISGVQGFQGRFADSYGNYKDKAADAKLRVMAESDHWPAITLGIQDLQGTGLFNSNYLVGSKQVGDFDLTLGYGSGRIDGAFGGFRYRPPSWSNVALLAEWDANDYTKDLGSVQSGAAERKKGPAVGVEYQWGWMGFQASYRQRAFGLNAFFSIPLGQQDFVPKLDEPAPYTKLTPRPSLVQWQSDRRHSEALLDALYAQDYKKVRVVMQGTTLELALTNSRISALGRAIGRAARTALLLAPRETREIRITYQVNDLSLATYTFVDLNQLHQYFNGALSRRDLARTVIVQYAGPESPRQEGVAEPLAGFEDPGSELDVSYNNDGDLVALRQDDRGGNRFRLAPKLGLYINDPSGAFRYDIFARATYDRLLRDRWFFRAAADATLIENVSGVDNPSNSLLPHVRTDVAEYKKGSRIKLNRLLMNKFYQPSERVYARSTAGIYEEMFAGLGGQVLYFPPRANWAADLSVDWLKQRDFKGGFGFRDYDTVTAIGALHYRLPLGMTVTGRAGRFLARDVGVRAEFKRRFPSGYEMGVWYTLTNGNDITAPGSPSSPYHDKGIYVSMPLNTMLTKDTQTKADMSLAPWTRDVGQMVDSPGDLYALIEKPLVIDFHDQDGLRGMGDVDDDYTYNLPSLGTSASDRPYLARFQNDLDRLGSSFASGQAWGPLAIGLGATALSASVDKRADRFVLEHQDNKGVRAIAGAGSAVPVLAGLASGIFAMNTDDPRLSGTAEAALQAGLVAAVGGVAGKFALGRSRPEAGQGAADFHPLKSSNGNSSFPSIHASVAWAALTPYAKEYDMPWLYGLALLSNAGRVAGRDHWVSDTVGGAFLGYAIGSSMWDSHRRVTPGSAAWSILPDGVQVAWLW